MIIAWLSTRSANFVTERPASTAQVGDQQFECRLRHRRDRLLDGGELGPDARRKRGIVEPDNAEIARHVEAAAVCNADRRRGHVVVAGEDRRRRVEAAK